MFTDLGAVDGWLAWLPGALMLTSGLIAALVTRWRDARKPPIPRDWDQGNVEQRFRQLSKTLQSSAVLMRQIETELAAREVAARELREQANESQRLAELHAESREAVRQMLSAELASQAKADARRTLWSNVAFFVAGVLASVAVTLWISPLG